MNINDDTWIDSALASAVLPVTPEEHARISEAKAQIQQRLIEARIDTANHLHRNQGSDLPKRDYDNDTDEYICTTYIPLLEAQLSNDQDKPEWEYGDRLAGDKR